MNRQKFLLIQNELLNQYETGEITESAYLALSNRASERYIMETAKDDVEMLDKLKDAVENGDVKLSDDDRDCLQKLLDQVKDDDDDKDDDEDEDDDEDDDD